MDSEVVGGKILEYTGKAGVASALGKEAKARSAARMVLLMLRLQSRAAYTRLLEASRNMRSAKRSMKLAEQSGVSFPLGKQWVEKYQRELRAAKAELSEVGKETCVTLDLWKCQGATLRDLCNLCCKDYGQAIKQIGPDRLDEWFSSLVFIYNLDYKDPSNRGFIDYEVDAPLTHAVKDHMLDLMLNTPEGRRASHEALEKFFPGIMENAARLVTDADGVQHLIDKDGVEVGTVEED